MIAPTPPRTVPEREKLHKEAARRWTKLGREHPELVETIAFGRGVVALYIDELPQAATVALTPERAREKLAAGIPLLEDEDIDLDLPGIRRFFTLLCDLATGRPELATAAARLQAALRSHETLPDELLAAALAGDADALEAAAADLAIEVTALRTLTSFTVSAAFLGVARALAPLATAANLPLWEVPSCPVCGGPPLLAELQGSSGERKLRCAICGTGWRILVNRCAHCGTEDQQMLHYLAKEGQEGKYRVDLCDRCHGYLASFTSFAVTPPELLTIEDAALLSLGAAARARGYTATPDIAPHE